jgi:hypothetical protein
VCLDLRDLSQQLIAVVLLRQLQHEPRAALHAPRPTTFHFLLRHYELNHLYERDEEHIQSHQPYHDEHANLCCAQLRVDLRNELQ